MAVRRFLFTSALALIALCSPAALPAAAAPQDLARTPDGELRLCQLGESCISRAVGDFNGDGQSDLLFERVPSGSMAQMLSSQRSSSPIRRYYLLALSPFKATPVARAPSAALSPSAEVRLAIDTAQALQPVSVADANGDKVDDLLFYSMPAGSIYVMLGQPTWPESRLVGGTQKPDLIRLDLPEAGARGRIEALFADVNGDGVRDLVVGTQGVDPLRNARSSLSREGAGNQLMIVPGPIKLDVGRPLVPTTQIVDLGACAASLAGIADVTGDGLEDLVVRRCSSETAPTELRVVPGRRTWPSTVSADEAPNVPNVPRPTAIPRPGVPVPPGGYLPSGPDLPLRQPEPFWIADVNGDGIRDLAMEFAGKTHLWYGGADIVNRARLNRTSGVLVKAGWGALPLSGSWKMADFTGDGKADLILSRSVPADLLLCPDGSCRDKSSAATPVNGQPLYLYSRGQSTVKRVVNVELDAPDGLWSAPNTVIWGMGDFNGDKQTDLLFGSPPGALDSNYTVVYGPLTAGKN